MIDRDAYLGPVDRIPEHTPDPWYSFDVPEGLEPAEERADYEQAEGDPFLLLGTLFVPEDWVLARLLESWTEEAGPGGRPRKRSRIVFRWSLPIRCDRWPQTLLAWLRAAEAERANFFFGVTRPLRIS